MNVVLYMRYSSERQTEQSIEGQERVCNAFCTAQGYNIVGRYIDRATSAYKESDKRLEFQRMIRDAERGSFQGVVVYKLDRFARNRYDSATYKAKLKRAGVKVISATECISDSPEGVILESVLEGMAEFYSAELSQKINRGLEETARKGQVTGGTIPIGYKIENHRYVEDPATSHIVREAFDLYSTGTSMQELIKLFNGKGYHTSRGGTWNKGSFHRMFRNRKYLGEYKWRDITVEDALPALIDVDTFDQVQAKISMNEHAPSRSKAKVNYLLSGKIFCGHCGSTMIGETGTGNNRNVYNYYVCSCKRRQHQCNKRNEKQIPLEQAVLQDTLGLLTPEKINELAEGAATEAERINSQESVIPALQAQLDDNKKASDNLMKILESGVVSDTILQRLSELESAKKDILLQMQDADKNKIVLTKDMVVWWLNKFLDGDIKDPEFCKRLIDLMVEKVIVSDDNDGYTLTIHYNLTGESSVLTTTSPPNGHKPKTYVLIKKHPAV